MKIMIKVDGWVGTLLALAILSQLMIDVFIIGMVVSKLFNL